jgi:hypothetical protein
VTGPTGRPTETNELAHLSDAELAGYLDQDLTLDERRRVETHLDVCARCRGEAVALSRIALPVSTTATQRPARRRWPWLSAAAAAIVVGVLLPRLTSHSPSPDGVQRARRVTDAGGRSRLTLVSPANDLTVQTPVTFTWSSANADVYRIYVFTNTGDAVWIRETADTTISLPDSIALQSGVTYFWRVDAIANGITATTDPYRMQVRHE